MYKLLDYFLSNPLTQGIGGEQSGDLKTAHELTNKLANQLTKCKTSYLTKLLN